MKHSYVVGCECKRCIRECARRMRQATAESVKHPKVDTAAAKKHARWERERRCERRPVWGSAEWAETRGDDLGESPDY